MAEPEKNNLTSHTALGIMCARIEKLAKEAIPNGFGSFELRIKFQVQNGKIIQAETNREATVTERFRKQKARLTGQPEAPSF